MNPDEDPFSEESSRAREDEAREDKARKNEAPEMGGLALEEGGGASARYRRGEHKRLGIILHAHASKTRNQFH